MSRAGVWVMALAVASAAGGCTKPTADGEGVQPRKPQPATAAANIEGFYHRGPDALAEMRVTRVGDQYRIEVDSGTDGSLGAGSPADCIWAALGPLRDGRITGRFLSLEPNDDDSLSVGSAMLEAGQVEVTFADGNATVTRADVGGLCGLGSDSTGRYTRAEQPPADWPDFRY